MIGLAISYRPFNISLRIQGLQFSSAPWSNTPRKQYLARHFMKHAKEAIL